MAETGNLGLSLLEAAQSQKHVTVNEALSRLDGICQMVLSGVEVTAPPGTVSGVWAIGAGASDAWFGQDGRIAIASNGGWEFVTPKPGWKAHVESESADAVYDGTGWVLHAKTLSPSGAGILFETVETVHTITSGTESSTAAFIPGQSTVCTS